MKFTKLDVIDWEPARLAFIFSHYDANKAAKFQNFVTEWFQERSNSGVCDCTLGYVNFKKTNSKKTVIMESEWMCDKCVRSLADTASSLFPDLKSVELGLRINGGGAPSPRFVRVPEKSVELEDGRRVVVKSFSIARQPVTVGEFKKFVEATGYLTSAEQKKDSVNFSRHFGLSGFSEKARMGAAACQLSFCDATAYCEHVGYRLPTEVEWLAAAVTDPAERDLNPLQEVELLNRPLGPSEIECSFVDLTSTNWNGFIIARAGPYRFIKKGWRDERTLKYNRRLLRPDEYNVQTTFRLVGVREGTSG